MHYCHHYPNHSQNVRLNKSNIDMVLLLWILHSLIFKFFKKYWTDIFYMKFKLKKFKLETIFYFYRKKWRSKIIFLFKWNLINCVNIRENKGIYPFYHLQIISPSGKWCIKIIAPSKMHFSAFKNISDTIKALDIMKKKNNGKEIC